MASKNKKRRPPKRRKRPGEAAAKTDRLQQRAMRMTPRAGMGECVEDVAVFDDNTRESLSKEMADQVSAVRDALAAVADKNDVRATQLLRLIPRKSPYSQWRLLVRGLIDWYADHPSKADESFSRLDPSRRPFRIAESLVAAKSHRLEGSGGVPGAVFVRTWLI